MKRIHPLLRIIFLLGGFLSLTAGIQLFVLAEHTEIYFAWTIQSPLTAATLGGFFFGTMAFGFLAVREKVWANVRGAVLGLFVLLFLTMVATFLHLDKFHLGSQHPFTILSTWLWLCVYTFLPFVVLAALILQGRIQGSDPEPVSTLPVWVRVLVFLHGISGFVIAMLLFLFPQTIISAWPWSLTPLTSRALAAWLMAFSIVDLQMFRDNDWSRTKIVSFEYMVAVLFAMIALARYSNEVNWHSAGVVGYLFYLIVMLGIGVTGYLKTRRIKDF